MSSATTNSSTVPSPPLAVAPRSVPSLEDLYQMTSEPDQRVVIRGVDWAFYEQLADSIPERCHIHVDYDGKDVEIMSPGLVHDNDKRLLGQLVEAIAQVLGVPYKSAGQTTWKRSDVARGLEADESYFFHADKLDAVAAGKARRSLDIAEYPNPDLGIEVDMYPRRSTGQRSMPRSKSPRSGASTGSTSRSSSSGWRTTAPTALWTEARSCRCTPRRFVAGSSKKTPTTNPSGRVVSAPGSVPSWLRGCQADPRADRRGR